MENSNNHIENRVSNLSGMIRGWYAGNFTPSVFRTDLFEAAVQRYKSGQTEPSHTHKIATEITVIVTGEASMNGVVYKEGDIVVINPGEITDFVALTDVVTAVVKVPSIPNDKYIIE